MRQKRAYQKFSRKINDDDEYEYNSDWSSDKSEESETKGRKSGIGKIQTAKRRKIDRVLKDYELDDLLDDQESSHVQKAAVKGQAAKKKRPKGFI